MSLDAQKVAHATFEDRSFVCSLYAYCIENTMASNHSYPTLLAFISWCNKQNYGDGYVFQINELCHVSAIDVLQ